MIPRTIHYCWFGGNPMPPLALMCIASWRKHLPEYRIVEWNETNFDITSNTYMRQAYDCKKWAFVSDYARLAVLYEYGGIYLDVDVEVTRSLERFLHHGFFTGFEATDHVPTGLLGAQAKHPWIGHLLKEYTSRLFILSDGSMDLTTNVEVITTSAVKKGLRLDGSYQVLDGDVHFYPPDWFCPLDYATGELRRTVNTHSIHYFQGSWKPPSALLKHKFMQVLHRRLGPRAVKFFVFLKRRFCASGGDRHG